MIKRKKAVELMKGFIHEYEMYLNVEAKLSKNTSENYIRDISQYCEFLMKYRNISNPEDITIDDVRSYLNSLKRNHISSVSQSRKLFSHKIISQVFNA